MTVTLKPTSTASSIDDQREALSAPVRDPVWLLARQWQTAAFQADDAGTPVHVELAHTVAPLSVAGTQVRAPLEPMIEAEPVPAIENVGTSMLVRFAVDLLRRLAEAGVPASSLAPLRAEWTTRYPLRASDPHSTLAPVAARLPNPINLFHLLAGSLTPDGSGTLPASLDISAAGASAASAVKAGLGNWYACVAGRVAAPGTSAARSATPASWNTQRLEYSFAATTSTPTGALTLQASDYDGFGMDWFSFDAQASSAPPASATSGRVAVHPAPVAYPGMPRPRFWEFEDGDVNLDTLRDSGGPAHALLATFAHSYANDWFVVPLPDIDAGVVVVTELTVRDTFGTSTTVPSVADVDAGAVPWRLWEATGVAAARGARVLVPATPTLLQGPVLEDVRVARDEMANLAWVIELITRDGDGRSVDRYQRYLSHPLRRPDDPSFRPADRTGRPNYRLGTTVPDFWYPLVAVLAADGQPPLLEIAALPPQATGVPDTGVRGILIDKTPGTRLADEEASREGIRVIRRDRMVRTPTGVTAWRARIKDAGRGEASSGLRFDVLE